MAANKPTRNIVDRAVAWLSPSAAVKRAQARQVLAYYEATDRKFNRMRPSMARVFGLETRSVKAG